MKPRRAFILLKSGQRLDLLDPQPDAWTNKDLAIGLSRTYRWGGYSAWPLPLSVAQHSLAVLVLRQAESSLSARESLREILHDSTEVLLGGWDCIGPLKPHLGPEFHRLDARLQAVVDQRYRLPPWPDESYTRHKHADRLAAANEAFHAVGWTRQEMRDSLGIALDPLDRDPLPVPPGMQPWEPWPPGLAAKLFLDRLQELLTAAGQETQLAALPTKLSPAARAVPRTSRQ